MQNHKPTVLIVDDEPVNIDKLGSILSPLFSIKVAMKGENAIAIAQEQEIACILLDIMMPGMSGYDVIKKLKSDPKTECIPVIFVTGKTDDEDEVLGFELGAVDYIKKPYEKTIVQKRTSTHVKIFMHERHLQEMVDEAVQKNMKLQEENFNNQKKAAMGELIGIIAHQLKQPLSVISLVIQDAEDRFEYGTFTKQEMDNMSQRAFKSIKFMSSSIDDLRNFFRTDKQITPFSIKHALEKALDLIETTIVGQGIEINQESVDDAIVKGIESELQQVIINIVTNAKEAFSEKKLADKWIKVAVFKEKEWAVLEIEDNAGGIPEDIIDHVFGSYFTTKGESGTGIGLSLSKMIVEGMNGKIMVSNTQNGAKFRIQLPVFERDSIPMIF